MLIFINKQQWWETLRGLEVLRVNQNMLQVSAAKSLFLTVFHKKAVWATWNMSIKKFVMPDSIDSI